MRRPHFEISDMGFGEIAHVHTRVELFYREFLDELDIKHDNDDALFSAHIKVLIWGVLYIEGLLNYKLYSFTKANLKQAKLVESYWELTKQSRIQDKLDLILASDNVKRPWFKGLAKRFTKMVDERNRLVHFKDIPTPFNMTQLIKRIGPNAESAAWLEHTPPPKIVSDLLSTPISERLDVFRLLGDALEDIKTGG